jgi:hypothetical protein
MTNYSVADLSVQQLRQVLAIREQIEALKDQLAGILGAAATSAPAVRARAASPTAKTLADSRKRGGISAAGRARIAAAQRARWAKTKAEQAAVVPAAPAKGKRGKLSTAGRARIIAAQKARWAKTKTAKTSKAGKTN